MRMHGLVLIGLAIAESISASASPRASAGASVLARADGPSAITASFKVGVPSNNGNPFLDTTTMPEGTLFIACGSILLALFVGVVIWRAAEVYSARKASELTQEKYQELANKASNFHKVEADYDLSVPGTFNATPQLFFSPTANVMQNGATGPMSSMVAHTGTYLPAGYYNSRRDRLQSPMPSETLESQSTEVRSEGALRHPSPAPARTQRPPSEFLHDLLTRS